MLKEISVVWYLTIHCIKHLTSTSCANVLHKVLNPSANKKSNIHILSNICRIQAATATPNHVHVANLTNFQTNIRDLTQKSHSVALIGFPTLIKPLYGSIHWQRWSGWLRWLPHDDSRPSAAAVGVDIGFCQREGVLLGKKWPKFKSCHGKGWFNWTPRTPWICQCAAWHLCGLTCQPIKWICTMQ